MANTSPSWTNMVPPFRGGGGGGGAALLLRLIPKAAEESRLLCGMGMCFVCFFSLVVSFLCVMPPLCRCQTRFAVWFGCRSRMLLEVVQRRRADARPHRNSDPGLRVCKGREWTWAGGFGGPNHVEKASRSTARFFFFGKSLTA